MAHYGWAVQEGPVVSVEALRRTVEAAFPELWPPTEAVLATCLALCVEDMVNPPTCVLTGPASTGKTTVLDFLGTGDEKDALVYRSDRFTPKALVTHASSVKREKLPELTPLTSPQGPHLGHT